MGIGRRVLIKAARSAPDLAPPAQWTEIPLFLAVSGAADYEAPNAAINRVLMK